MSKHNIGTVYAISFQDGRTKIGRTRNVEQRLRAICSGYGYCYDTEARFFHIETANYYEVETSAHRVVGKLYGRNKGEWFNCSVDEAAEVIDSLSVPFTEEDRKHDEELENDGVGALTDAVRRMIKSNSISNSSFDYFNIGGELRDELLDALLPAGGKDGFEKFYARLRCISIGIKTKNAIYFVYPDGGEKYLNQEDYEASFVGSGAEFGEEDLCPYDFYIDISTPELCAVWL